MSMKNNGLPSGVAALLAAAALLLFFSHASELNGLPGISVTGGEFSVDIGDFHYSSQ